MIWRKLVKPTIGLKIGGIFSLVLLLATINTVVLYTVLQEFNVNSESSLIADDFYLYSKRIANAVLFDDGANAAGELARNGSKFEQRLRALRMAHPPEHTTLLAVPNDEIVSFAEMVSIDWSVFREAARELLQDAKKKPQFLTAENDLLAGVLALRHGLTLHGQTVQARAATILYSIIGLDALLLFGVFVLIKRTMVRPIVQLSQMSRRIAAGDYGARMAFDSRDEIGELVTAFNSAAHETQQLLEKISREETELAERENLLQMIFDTEPECVALLDPDTRFQKINRMGLAMLDAESIEALGESSLCRLVQSEYLSKLQALVHNVMDGAGGRIELALTGLRGRHVWVEAHLVPLRPQQDGAVHLLAIIHNISERKRNEDSLRLLKRAVESSSNGIVIADTQQPGNPIVYVNPAFERITGYTADEAIGRNGQLLQRDDFHQPGLEEIRAALREQREGRAIVRNYRKDGSLFWNELHIAPVHDEHGRIAHYVGIQNDISERMHYEEQLAHQAKHDALTGLPNRSLLEDRLHHGLNHSHRQKRRMAVVFVDLDHFKFINDSLGHDLGDRLLVTVANRLKDCLREDDTVARQGGDEFVLILSDAQDDHLIVLTLQRIIAAIVQPVTLGGRDIVVTCSIGVSVYPEDGQDSQALLKSADLAMYRAKEQGRNCFQFYTAEMNARVTERLSLESDLRRALAQGEFLLHFQPQVDLLSGRISGVEALVRWQHPEIGMIAPNRFIPLSEDTGLIVPLGEWVLTAACAQVKAWLDAGLPIPSVAVNISAVQFRQGNLVQTVKRVLESTGLAPQYLELELTESLVMHNVEQVITFMAELKSLGVKISLDDFGTGYSSLYYLKRFPLDKLKIDQSFVRDLATDPGDAAIVRSVILLAHSLGLEVIAEGVETAEQLAYLCGQRCDQIQGYLFSRPIPADDLEEMLRLGKILRTSPQIVGITSAPVLNLSR